MSYLIIIILLTELDVMIGLPKQENYRCARQLSQFGWEDIEAILFEGGLAVVLQQLNKDNPMHKALAFKEAERVKNT